MARGRICFVHAGVLPIVFVPKPLTFLSRSQPGVAVCRLREPHVSVSDATPAATSRNAAIWGLCREVHRNLDYRQPSRTQVSCSMPFLPMLFCCLHPRLDAGNVQVVKAFHPGSTIGFGVALSTNPWCSYLCLCGSHFLGSDGVTDNFPAVLWRYYVPVQEIVIS